MDLFGLKWTIILAEVGYIFYIVANIKPLPPLMYISKYLHIFYKRYTLFYRMQYRAYLSMGCPIRRISMF